MSASTHCSAGRQRSPEPEKSRAVRSTDAVASATTPPPPPPCPSTSMPPAAPPVGPTCAGCHATPVQRSSCARTDHARLHVPPTVQQASAPPHPAAKRQRPEHAPPLTPRRRRRCAAFRGRHTVRCGCAESAGSEAAESRAAGGGGQGLLAHRTSRAGRLAAKSGSQRWAGRRQSRCSAAPAPWPTPARPGAPAWLAARSTEHATTRRGGGVRPVKSAATPGHIECAGEPQANAFSLGPRSRPAGPPAGTRTHLLGRGVGQLALGVAHAPRRAPQRPVGHVQARLLELLGALGVELLRLLAGVDTAVQATLLHAACKSRRGRQERSARQPHLDLCGLRDDHLAQHWHLRHGLVAGGLLRRQQPPEALPPLHLRAHGRGVRRWSPRPAHDCGGTA